MLHGAAVGMSVNSRRSELTVLLKGTRASQARVPTRAYPWTSTGSPAPAGAPASRLRAVRSAVQTTAPPM